MCFSATASFVSAGVTGAIGIATLAQARSGREVPLAGMPLLFALQQGVEGGLWLALPGAGDSALVFVLTHAFLVLALAFWPVFAPLSVWLIEPQPMRRRAMAACGLIGVAVALYFVATVLALPHGARIAGHHIVYTVGTTAPFSVGGLYLLATGIALALSSHRAVALMGAIVLAGSILSYAFYEAAFVSVWCFFAAGSSVLLFAHFYRLRIGEAAGAALTHERT